MSSEPRIVGATLASPAAAKRAPVRQPIPRLDDFDYTAPGAYFVTTVTTGRLCVFGSIVDDKVTLSRRGLVVQRCWLDVPNHRANVRLDEFIVMPNHFHAILWIEEPAASVPVGATLASPVAANKTSGPQPASLSAIVGGFKSAVAREINRLRPGAADDLWQRSFYDRVIRDRSELIAIRAYILRNPECWPSDEHNANAISPESFDAFMRSLETSNGDAGNSAAAGDASVAPTGQP